MGKSVVSCFFDSQCRGAKLVEAKFWGHDPLKSAYAAVVDDPRTTRARSSVRLAVRIREFRR